MSSNISNIISKISKEITTKQSGSLVRNYKVTLPEKLISELPKGCFLPLVAIPALVAKSNLSVEGEKSEKVTLKPLTEREIAEAKYLDDYARVEAELREKGVDDLNIIDNYIQICSYVDKNGYPVFSEELKDAYDRINKVLPPATLGNSSIRMDLIKQEDPNTGRVTIDSDIISVIEKMANANVHSSAINSVLEFIADNNNGVVDAEILQHAWSFKKYNEEYDERLIRLCYRNEKFQSDIAAIVSRAVSLGYNMYDIQRLLTLTVSEEDNECKAKPSTIVYDIFTAVKDDKLSTYDFEDIAEAIDIEDYLKFHSKAVAQIGKSYVSTDEVLNFLQATLSKRVGRSGFYSSQLTEEKYFNYSNLDRYKRLQEQFISEKDDYEEKKGKQNILASIMRACKINDIWGACEFQEDILQKALSLIETGVPLVSKEHRAFGSFKYTSQIPKIINACKLKKVSYDGKKYEVFDEEVFSKAIEFLKKYPNKYYELYKLLDISKSKEYLGKNEIFKSDIFDLCLAHLGYFTPSKIKTLFPDGRVDIEVLRKIEANRSIVKSVEYLFEEGKDINGNKRIHFNPSILDAYKKLSTLDLDCEEGKKLSRIESIVYWCKTKGNYPFEEFDSYKFNKIYNMLKSGYSYNDALEIFQSRNNRYEIDFILDLCSKGVDKQFAICLASMCVDKETGKVDEQKLQQCKELYDLGLEPCNINTAYNSCYETIGERRGFIYPERKFSDVAFERLKCLLKEGFNYNVLSACFDNGMYSDRQFRLLLNLKEAGFTVKQSQELMNVCLVKRRDKSKEVLSHYDFNKRIYDAIFELEKLGIEKENIKTVLESCKDEEFSEERFKKVVVLHNRGYEDTAVALILTKANSTKKDKSFEERYNEILAIVEPCKKLKTFNYSTDTSVITELLAIEKNINIVLKNFGPELLSYAVSLKLDGYKSFIEVCANIVSKTTEQFINYLNEKLESLPSPDLKLKRLMFIGGLAGKVDENVLTNLVGKIKSPEISEEQIELANKIFSDTSKDYQTQVEEFIKALKTPKQQVDKLRNYLSDARLNEQIERPKSITEQLAQMEVFAQQILINPKIPLDKKIKYIDEYKSKKEDMINNPVKYTSPRIYSKVMANLAKVVMTYVNIPTEDLRFNNSVTETMYSKFGVEVNEELINRIKYDSKYFSTLLGASTGFYPNFRRLIELVKLNDNKTVQEMRMFLPEEGSELYNEYSRLGLIEQIKANLDTKRQFDENGLNFEKWNKFDPNLVGEGFEVNIDPQNAYNDLVYNIIDELQGEMLAKLSKEEVAKLFSELSGHGFVLFDNKLSKNGNQISNPDILRVLDIILNYAEKSEYWIAASKEGDIKLSTEEKDGILGFLDHIKGHKKSYENIKNGKNVGVIHFRLSDDNDIGRNIFFGNHVNCCNSVNSSYAGYSAPQHVINSYVRGFELVDEYGNSYGNSLCYFALIDGKISFVIDSFEANGKLGSNPMVTEKLVDFAKQVCREMGRENAQVVLGPRYNNIVLSGLESSSFGKVEVIGSVSHETYCDLLGGKGVMDLINNSASNCSGYIL